MTQALSMEAPPTLASLPFVYLSYDEPWADAGWADLQAKVPRAVRVHGVRGLDACHKAAAEAAGTDHFVTIDADTTVDAGIGDTAVPRALVSDKVRLIWPSRNALNGLVSGNGSVKLWPRALVMAMRTHEAAPPETLSLDHDLGNVEPGLTRSVDLPGPLATTDPARTPRHAFRAGFREGAYLDRLLSDLAARHGADDPRTEALRSILTVWASVGRHTPNGLWVVYGVRLALWLARSDAGRDLRVLNDYGALDDLWSDWVLPRFSPGGTRCPWTGDTWDTPALADEVATQGARLTGLGLTGLAEIGAEESRMIAGASVVPAARNGAALDGLGWALVQGKGVHKNPAEARVWFEAAHALGHPGGALNLAKLSEQGAIAERTPNDIRRLYRVAVARGDPWAADRLAAFEATLARAGNHLAEPANRGDACICGSCGIVMLLADLPWLWCGAPSPVTGPAPPPDTAHLFAAPDAGELADAARSMSAPLCVLILPDIHPWPTAGTLSPDPVLTASGRPLMYPAENALTGDCTPDHGLWVLSPALVAAQAGPLVSGAAAQALAPLVPPALAATWDCGTTPEAAFRAGHAAMLDSLRGPALALTASLGADRPNGLWWGIGAARALLGDAADSAWSNESTLALPAGDLSARRAELARMARVRCGLPMHPMDADTAAALRRMRAPVASPDIWDRHTADLQALMLGANDAPVIKGHRLARAAVWGPV